MNEEDLRLIEAQLTQARPDLTLSPAGSEQGFFDRFSEQVASALYQGGFTTQSGDVRYDQVFKSDPRLGPIGGLTALTSYADYLLTLSQGALAGATAGVLGARGERLDRRITEQAQQASVSPNALVRYPALFASNYLSGFSGIKSVGLYGQTTGDQIVAELGSLAGLLSVFFRNPGASSRSLVGKVARGTSVSGAARAAAEVAPSRFARPLFSIGERAQSVQSLPVYLTSRITDNAQVQRLFESTWARSHPVMAQIMQESLRGGLVTGLHAAGFESLLGASPATAEDIFTNTAIGVAGGFLGAAVANLSFLQSSVMQKALAPALSKTTTRAQVAQAMIGTGADVSLGVALGETDPRQIVKNAILGAAFAGLDAPWYVHQADRYIFSLPDEARVVAHMDPPASLPLEVRQVLRERVEFYKAPTEAQNALAEVFTRLGKALGEDVSALTDLLQSTGRTESLTANFEERAGLASASRDLLNLDDFDGSTRDLIAPVHRFVKQWAQIDGLELDASSLEAATSKLTAYLDSDPENTNFAAFSERIRQTYSEVAGPNAPKFDEESLADLVPFYNRYKQFEQVDNYGWNASEGRMVKMDGLDFSGGLVDERLPMLDPMRIASEELGVPARETARVVRFVTREGRQERLGAHRFKDDEWTSFIGSMAADDFYLFSGKEASPQFLFMKHLAPRDPDEIAVELRRIFSERPDLQGDYAAMSSRYGNDYEYARMFVSNVKYWERLNDLSIGQLKDEGFLSSVGDFNKRMQIVQTPYFRVLDEFMRDEEGNQLPLRYALVEDDAAYVEALKDLPEMTDGAVLVREEMLDRLRSAVGIAPGGGFAKPFILSKGRPGADETPRGLLMVKAAFHGAGSELSTAMENSGVDFLIFGSAAKQRGRRKLGRVHYEDGTLRLEDVEILEMEAQDIRLSDSIYDDGRKKANKGTRLPKSLWAMMTSEQVSDAAWTDMVELLVREAKGRQEANVVFDRYRIHEAESDLKLLFEGEDPLIRHVRLIGPNSLPAMLGDHRYERLHDRFAEHLMKDSSEHLEDGTFETTPGEFYEPHVSADRGSDAMAHLRVASHPSARLHRVSRNFYQKALMNHFIKRLSSPSVDASGTAVMRAFDVELQSRIRLDEDLTDDTFFLDDDWKDVMIPYSGGKKKLEEVYALSRTGTADQKAAAAEALGAVVTRTPMEDISGAQSLTLAGFTGRRGSGILLHGKTMRRLQGADLDIDKANFYFGMPRNIRESLRANKENLDRAGGRVDRALLKHFVEERTDPLSKTSAAMFDPLERMQVAHAAQQGQGTMAGVAFNAGTQIHTLMSAANRRGGIFTDGTLAGQGVRVVYHARGDGGDELRVRRMAAVRAGVDAAKLPGAIVSPAKTRAALLDAAFSKIEIHTPRGVRTVRKLDQFAGRGFQVKDQFGNPHVVSLTAMGKQPSAAGRFSEVNNFLYGRNRQENRAHSFGEILSGASRYPAELPHMLGVVSDGVAHLDYDDSLFKRVSTDSNTWGSLVEELNGYVRDNEELRRSLGLRDGEAAPFVPQRDFVRRMAVNQGHFFASSYAQTDIPRARRRSEAIRKITSKDREFGVYIGELWAAAAQGSKARGGGQRFRLLEALVEPVRDVREDIIEPLQRASLERSGFFLTREQVAEEVQRALKGQRRELWERNLSDEDLQAERFPVSRMTDNVRSRRRFVRRELREMEDFISNDLDTFKGMLHVARRAQEGGIASDVVRAVVEAVDEIKTRHAQSLAGKENPELDERSSALARAREEVSAFRRTLDERARQAGLSPRAAQGLLDAVLLSPLRPPDSEGRYKRADDQWRSLSSRLGLQLASDRSLKEHSDILSQMFRTLVPPADPSGVRQFLDASLASREASVYLGRKEAVRGLLAFGKELSAPQTREAQRLSDSITEMIENHYPAMRDDPQLLTDFVRGVTGKAQGSDMTMEDVLAVHNTLKEMTQGYGFWNWFHRNVSKKAQQAPVIVWSHFPQTSADQLLAKDVSWVHQMAGSFTEPNLTTSVPSHAGMKRLYGDAVVPMSTFHRVIHRRKTAERLIAAAQEEIDNLVRSKVGWVDSGIRRHHEIIGRDVSRTEPDSRSLFDLAMREMELEGANSYVQARVGTGEPRGHFDQFLMRYQDRLFEVDRSERERLSQSQYRVKRSALTREGIFGRSVAVGREELMTGRQVINLIKRDVQEALGQIYDEQVSLDGWAQKNVVRDRRQNAPAPVVRIKPTTDQLGRLLDHGKLDRRSIPHDGANFIVYHNAITQRALERAPDMRLPKTLDQVDQYRYDFAVNEAFKLHAELAGLRLLRSRELVARLDEIINRQGTSEALAGDAQTIRDYIRRPLSEFDARRLLGQDYYSQYEWDRWLATQMRQGDGTTRSNARLDYQRARLEEQSPFQRTGRIEGYWPHLDFDVQATTKEILARMERAKTGEKDPLVRQDKMEKLAALHAQLLHTGGYSDGYLGEPLAENLITPSAHRAMEKISDQQRAGAALKREHNIGGYSYAPDVIYKYGSQVATASYRSISTMLADNAIRDFEQRKPFEENHTKAWATRMRIYLHQTLGYPSTYPDTVLNMPEMRLKHSPLWLLSDQAFFMKGGPLNKMAAAMSPAGRLSEPEQAVLREQILRTEGRAANRQDFKRARTLKRKAMTDVFREVPWNTFLPGERAEFAQQFEKDNARAPSVEEEMYFLNRPGRREEAISLAETTASLPRRERARRALRARLSPGGRTQRPVSDTALRAVVARDGEPRWKVFNTEGLEMMSRRYRGFSNLEAKWEMMSLLFRPKTAVINVLGGDINTVVYNGMKPWWQSWSIGEAAPKAWQKVDKRFKTAADVNEHFIKGGVVENFILHEMQYNERMRGSAQWRAFAQDLGAQMRASPSVWARLMGEAGDQRAYRTIVAETARRHGLSEQINGAAAWFMRKTELIVRLRAAKAAWLKSYYQYEGIVDVDSAFLMEKAMDAVSATQFIYSAEARPAFAATSLGKVYSRFKLWSWNSVRLRRMIGQEAARSGYRSASPEFDRLRRMIQADAFMLAMASFLPYTIFETQLPPPWNWFQDAAELIFGDEDERDRAFFGKYSTVSVVPNVARLAGLPEDEAEVLQRMTAPLNELLPPALRPLKVLESALSAAMGHDDFASYTMWSLFPGGLAGRDVYKTFENPQMAPYFLMGYPGTQISTARRKAGRIREVGPRRADLEERRRQQRQSRDR